MLIVFAGRPGSGKTTLSRRVATELGAAVLRIDAIETAVLRCGLGQRPLGPVGYVVAHEIARGCLAAGTPVVVDAVHPVPDSRSGWRELADAAGVALTFVEVHLDDIEEHRRRVEQRRPDMEGQAVPTWDEVRSATYVAWDGERDGPCLRVDGGDCDRAHANVLAHLDETHGQEPAPRPTQAPPRA